MKKRTEFILILNFFSGLRGLVSKGFYSNFKLYGQ